MFCDKVLALAVCAVLVLNVAPAFAEEVNIEIFSITSEGVGAKVGEVHAYDSDNGLVLSVKLSTLPVGPHGFHVHENGSCDPAMKDGQMVAGLAAGGHYDPDATDKHLGPSGEGHKGDLPVIYVEPDEIATQTSFKRVKVVPRLTVSDIHGRTLMIHASGDNYSDEPNPLGGGGARIACGVVP
jgi:Cu-Zn family superoxide dismutase